MPIEPYYERDGITLYLGDCRDVLPTLGPVDHCITDPPYFRDVYTRLSKPGAADGSSSLRLGAFSSAKMRRAGIGTGRVKGAAITKLAAGDIGHVDEMVAPIALEVARLVARWALVFSDVENAHLWRAQLDLCGLRYVRTGAWVKPDAMPQFSGDRPSVGFEPCTIVHAPGKMRWNGGGHAALWTHNTVKGNAIERTGHPCPKPLALMRELVQLFTDPGETILDMFCGSGTTLLACANLGRKAIGVELSEQYAEIAVKRLESATPPLPLDWGDAGASQEAMAL